MRPWPAALGVVLALGACAPDGSTDADGQESAWGHLDDLSPKAPQFLVNKTRGQAFRVCMARYMTASLPGVRAEVEAAVNVWASYIGRSIPVQIVEADLPRATAGDTTNALSNRYHDKCGAGFDVVMGFAPMQVAIGLTGYSSMEYPDGRVASFRRYLFLRDYDVAPLTEYGVTSSWISLEQRTGTATNAQALLARMLQRNEVQYATGGIGLTLPVLTHEIGHVWGMCDQYEGSPGCDPQSSSSHPELDSIMGRASYREPLFLTDDDVTGIRKLAQRPGFAHDWGAPPSTPPATIALPDPELARIESVSRNGQTLVVRFGVVTRRPAKLDYFIRDHGTTKWTPLGSTPESTAGIDVPVQNLQIALGRPAPAQDARVRVSIRGANGAYALAADLVAHE